MSVGRELAPGVASSSSPAKKSHTSMKTRQESSGIRLALRFVGNSGIDKFS
jgi:hypothetical protein